MKDPFIQMQESEAARKAEEAAEIAAFRAAGKAKHLGYADEKYMKKVQKNWSREVSPTVLAKREEDSQFLLFSKGSLKS